MSTGGLSVFVLLILHAILGVVAGVVCLFFAVSRKKKDPQWKACVQCNHPVSPSAEVCDNCGTPLKPHG